VSQLFDRGAAALVERAHAGRGGWVQTRIGPPPARTVAWAAAQGIDLLTADPAAGSRWVRAFIRAAYRYNTWYQGGGGERLPEKNRDGLRYEVGRLYYARASGLGWPVRMQLVPAAALPAGPAYTADESVRSTLESRDWQAV